MNIKRSEIKERIIKKLSMNYYIEFFKNKAFDEYYNTLKKIVIKYYKDNEYRLSNEVLENCIYAITKSSVDEVYEEEQSYGTNKKYICRMLTSITNIKGYLYDKVDLYYRLTEETD